MACSGITDWRRPNGIVRAAAPDAAVRQKATAHVAGRGGGHHCGILVFAAGSTAARQSQSDHLLCRRGGAVRFRRRADCVCLRVVDLRLSCSDHSYAADGAGRTHGRGHEPSDPAGGAAVRVPRSPDRDDRHGAGNGGVSGQPARPCARRPALRADRRDVSRVGHFRLEGRRHGRRCAGAVS